MNYYEFSTAEKEALCTSFPLLGQYFIQLQGFSSDTWFVPETALIEFANYGEDEFMELHYYFWTDSTMPHVVGP